MDDFFNKKLQQHNRLSVSIDKSPLEMIKSVHTLVW